MKNCSWYAVCNNNYRFQAKYITMDKSRATYKQFKIRCPNCSAVVVTMQPEAMIWEQCPSCRAHTWDTYDLLMAERHTAQHAGNGTVRSSSGSGAN